MNTQKPVLLRELAIEHFTHGMTNKEIFEILLGKVSLRTIQRWTQEYKNSGKLFTLNLLEDLLPFRPYKKRKIPLLIPNHMKKYSLWMCRFILMACIWLFLFLCYKYRSLGQSCENRFPSGSELLQCEQVPERANFRNIPWILVMKRNSLWTFLLIAATKIPLSSDILTIALRFYAIFQKKQ
ncbi:hypothetical protein BpHYR1_009328 [Brachionus plicatilis]|uniref:Uncharacterized protein n=1 Tax=Brachionus plicatilis TaxID=10195 RepID=A0A3M7PZD6_BRAPC|nr:hypothetical protein BpHYR1_009328 [Brachionus plicatilis]